MKQYKLKEVEYPLTKLYFFPLQKYILIKIAINISNSNEKKILLISLQCNFLNILKEHKKGIAP